MEIQNIGFDTGSIFWSKICDQPLMRFCVRVFFTQKNCVNRRASKQLYISLRSSIILAHRVLPKAHYSAQTGTLFWNIFWIDSTPFHYLWPTLRRTIFSVYIELLPWLHNMYYHSWYPSFTMFINFAILFLSLQKKFHCTVNYHRNPKEKIYIRMIVKSVP